MQMQQHEHIIRKARHQIDDRIPHVFLHVSETMKAACKYKPSYQLMKQREEDDKVLSGLIRDTRGRCDHQLDKHTEHFRMLRKMKPNHLPSTATLYELQKSMETHEHVIRKARKWIDNEKPVKALHHRKIMQSTPYTIGGYPRPPKLQVTKKKGRRSRNVQPGATGQVAQSGSVGNNNNQNDDDNDNDYSDDDELYGDEDDFEGDDSPKVVRSQSVPLKNRSDDNNEGKPTVREEKLPDISQKRSLSRGS